MLDIEQAGLPQPEYAAAIMEWLQQVGTRLGCTPVIYTNTGFWNASVGSYASFAASPLWIAQYTGNAGPALPHDARTYLFWQYSDTGAVGGISGAVDLTRYCATATALNLLLCR
jgi:lysozyme